MLGCHFLSNLPVFIPFVFENIWKSGQLWACGPFWQEYEVKKGNVYVHVQVNISVSAVFGKEVLIILQKLTGRKDVTSIECLSQ